MHATFSIVSRMEAIAVRDEALEAVQQVPAPTGVL